jgi:hypothetical protein
MWKPVKNGFGLRWVASVLFFWLSLGVFSLDRAEEPPASLTLDEICSRLELINAQLRTELLALKEAYMSSADEAVSLKTLLEETKMELDGLRLELKKRTDEAERLLSESAGLRTSLDKAQGDSVELRLSLTKATSSLEQAEKSLKAIEKEIQRLKLWGWVASIAAAAGWILYILLILGVDLGRGLLFTGLSGWGTQPIQG